MNKKNNNKITKSNKFTKTSQLFDSLDNDRVCYGKGFRLVSTDNKDCRLLLPEEFAFFDGPGFQHSILKFLPLRR